MTDVSKELLDELKEREAQTDEYDRLGPEPEVVVKKETLDTLIHAIEKRHEVLRGVLKAINEGHISAGEDFILKVNFLVKELEP